MEKKDITVEYQGREYTALWTSGEYVEEGGYWRLFSGRFKAFFWIAHNSVISRVTRYKGAPRHTEAIVHRIHEAIRAEYLDD